MWLRRLEALSLSNGPAWRRSASSIMKTAAAGCRRYFLFDKLMTGRRGSGVTPLPRLHTEGIGIFHITLFELLNAAFSVRVKCPIRIHLNNCIMRSRNVRQVLLVA